MVYGVAAYLLWGLMPAFFPLLLPAGPGEILAHRILWAAVIMIVVVSVRRGWAELRHAGLRAWARMAVAGVLIAANWLIYIVAVNTGHVNEAALGYFINPLLSVLLGMLVFRERLRPLQGVAVGLAAVAVLFLTVAGGQPPLIALSLALSFGFYGLLKKRLSISAAGSLTAETLVLAPFALGYLAWLEASDRGTFFSEGPDHVILMISSGLVTAVPLLLFGMGARLLALSTVGMLQYLTPTMQMLWAVFVVDETIQQERWIGFVIIWVAVAVFLLDLLRRRPPAAPRTGPRKRPAAAPPRSTPPDPPPQTGTRPRRPRR